MIEDPNYKPPAEPEPIEGMGRETEEHYKHLHRLLRVVNSDLEEDALDVRLRIVMETSDGLPLEISDEEHAARSARVRSELQGEDS